MLPFLNKTLCDIAENRDVKRNRTPHEGYAGQPEKFDAILSRVNRFKGNARPDKLRRFQQETIEDIGEFASRQLNDTRYATKQATDYLALLYGGLYELGGHRYIQASKGSITAYLRNEWQLNTILGDGGTKSRDDHRHHAVDAVAIALADATKVKALSEAAQRAEHKGTRWWRERVEDPWPGFLEDVRQAIRSINVSHRSSNKVNGQIHKDDNYARSSQNAFDSKPQSVRIRIPIEKLSLKEIENIVDDRVRELVKAKLHEVGGEPEKAFANKLNHPSILSRHGRTIPIHAVRVHRSQGTMLVGQGSRERCVVSGSNHHVEIFEVADKKGRRQWVGRNVTRYEAMRRLARRLLVVDRELKGGRFLFSLASGDIVQLARNSTPALYRIRTVSQTQDGYIRVEYVSLNEARLKNEIKEEDKKDKNAKGSKPRGWITSPIPGLAKMSCRKVTITPLGEVRYAND